MLLLVILLVCKVSFAGVILHDPTWEVPGGYVQVPLGISPAHSGGKTWDYSGFNSNAYDALYYVIGDYDYDSGPPEVWTFNPAGPAIGTSLNGMTRLHYDTLNSNLSGGSIAWSNHIYIYNAATLSNQIYEARFILSVYDGSGNPASLIEASTLTGMDALVGGTHQIIGDFTANWQFELSNMGVGNWNAAMLFFDHLSTNPSDSLQSSVTRAFYFTSAQVPGDFDADGDVDGTDISNLITDASLLDLEFFAGNFGRVN